jgi:hypothetical protein
MENEDVQLEDSNLDETLDSNQEETVYDDSEAKISKAEEIARNQRIRAEKAEKELKAFKAQPVQKESENLSNNNLSLKDIRALQDVHDEDVEEVTEYARFKGVSIAEAKKSQVVQTLLKTRGEERASANAANTGSNKRSQSKVSGETLIENFEKGIVSEKDEDIEKLVQAQFARKKSMSKGN